MKRILVLFACSAACVPVHTQWSCNNTITFDPGDSLYPAAITIDTATYHHNVWQVGAPHKAVFTSAFSLPNVIVTDTSALYPINDTSVFILKVPASVSGQQLLETQFSYRLDMDTGATASVAISADNGLHWNDVEDSLPANFYWDGDTANLSVSTTGWEQFFMAYRCTGCQHNADTLLFRFTFISDSVPATKDGWMIDNILVSYWCQNATLQDDLYPNPASTGITITNPNTITGITIFNILGETVFSSHYNANKIEVDVAWLPPAMYFVRINCENNYREVKKFVKG